MHSREHNYQGLSKPSEKKYCEDYNYKIMHKFQNFQSSSRTATYIKDEFETLENCEDYNCNKMQEFQSQNCY